MDISLWGNRPVATCHKKENNRDHQNEEIHLWPYRVELHFFSVREMGLQSLLGEMLLPSKQAKTVGNLNQQLANAVNLPYEVIFHNMQSFVVKLAIYSQRH